MAVGHVVTRSVRDSALFLDLTHGPAKGDPYCAPAFEGKFLGALASEPRSLRVALDLEPVSGATVHPECVEAVQKTAKLLERLGHRVEIARPAFDHQAFLRACDTLIFANVANSIQTRAALLKLEPGIDTVETLTLRLAKLGRSLGADLYAKSVVHIHAIGRLVESFFEKHDFILSPTLLQPPVRLGFLDTNGNDAETYATRLYSFWGFTSLYNATGQPAVSLPLHRSASGLPIGVQLAAPFGNEFGLLALSGQIERAVGGFWKGPPAL